MQLLSDTLLNLIDGDVDSLYRISTRFMVPHLTNKAKALLKILVEEKATSHHGAGVSFTVRETPGNSCLVQILQDGMHILDLIVKLAQ